MKKLTVLTGLFLSSSFAVTADAQEAPELTIERIFSSPALEGQAPRKLKVSPDGERVTFIQGKVTDYERYDLWEYNVASGETQVLFDADNLHTGNEELSDEEKARRERRREYGTGIMEYQWSPDGKALLFPLAGDAFYYSIGDGTNTDGKAQQILQTEAFETDI